MTVITDIMNAFLSQDLRITIITMYRQEYFDSIYYMLVCVEKFIDITSLTFITC